MMRKNLEVALTPAEQIRQDEERNRTAERIARERGPEPACRCGQTEGLIFSKQTEWMTLCRPCERIMND